MDLNSYFNGETAGKQKTEYRKVNLLIAFMIPPFDWIIYVNNAKKTGCLQGILWGRI